MIFISSQAKIQSPTDIASFFPIFSFFPLICFFSPSPSLFSFHKGRACRTKMMPVSWPQRSPRHQITRCQQNRDCWQGQQRRGDRLGRPVVYTDSSSLAHSSMGRVCYSPRNGTNAWWRGRNRMSTEKSRRIADCWTKKNMVINRGVTFYAECILVLQGG